MSRVRYVVVAVGLAAALSVPPSTAADQDAPEVRLQVPTSSLAGSTVTSVNQLGSVRAEAEVVSLDGGTVRVGSDQSGAKAFDFPAHSSSSAPPRSIVRVTHQQAGDPFAPGWNDFGFGAGFRKDSRSTGTKVDNGDNLIQRGLASDPSQYKIEVDSGRPACRIKGSKGALEVRSGVVVDPDLWYDVRCSRVGSSIKLAVVVHRRDGSTTRHVNTRYGTLGSLTWPKTKTPIAVGGKLAADGAVIRSATDQFNGVVTNPVLVIDG